MRRRDLVKGIVGSTVGWPLAARAQQRERMRRIGVLTPFGPDDAEGQARATAFTRALQQLGWTVGQNIRLEFRWGDGKADTMRKHAAERRAAPEYSFQSCSRPSPIQSALGTSKAWCGQAATPPDLPP